MKERDKIKSDLQVKIYKLADFLSLIVLQTATECSAALAVEIDEQNCRQEKIMKNQIEVKWLRK